MPWFRYRTIRGQLTMGFILLELLFTVCFSLLIIRTQVREIHARAHHRIEQQAALLATMATDALNDNETQRLLVMAQALEASTSVHYVRITDPHGAPLLPHTGHIETSPLSPAERHELPAPGHALRDPDLFVNNDGNREAVYPILNGSQLLGYAWVVENPVPERQEIETLIRITAIAGAFGVLACLLASTFLARSITRPLRMVMMATRRLIRDPETKEGFPLEVTETNEAGELAQALNLLVLAMEEQRAGLNDTLALLDSMLAHAPIGFAFLDRQGRFIRVNNFLATGMEIGLTDFLGRTSGELFRTEEAHALESRLSGIFDGSRPVDTFELQMTDGKEDVRTWLVNLYPVKSGAEVRWVGAVMIDTTERRRSEEALRRTEKLAAAGQLAASIAHEINNPLEAVTNLLFLLRTRGGLDDEAVHFTEMAQHELARVSEITQQTLRFYRPSTAPAAANVGEILDSMLTLHSGRIHTLRVQVKRRFRGDLDLFCLSGALRQVFANLITNALDALTGGGGRLMIRARRCHSWKDGRPGVRVVVADTGSGIPESVRQRIFEPFFTTKLATGTGLGLWVTQDIMGKHQGTIVVRSRSEGAGHSSGTVFMLFFPDHGVDRMAPVAEANEQSVSA